MKEKIVIFTGAGVSAESGLKTFRDMGGLWEQYAVEQVASPKGWAADPHLVLRFYNERRAGVLAAEPNAAHLAIARLEDAFDVVVITQNIDDLHERAGSTRVLHMHGEILKSRSTVDANLIYRMDSPTIAWGQLCEKGSQLRPDVVWFGENVRYLAEGTQHFVEASRVLVVGTSLTVYPAADLAEMAPYDAKKYLVSPERQKMPYGYRHLLGTATRIVPHMVEQWLAGKEPALDG
ncbi:SIR2 family NAD-dependent protein deacylase [Dyella sp.]|uniref:SIR2 family NAD-dependent protein deacylase n=1 Tax=Dyella sp. TaxID=1869338 RepID=UPI002ED209B6